MRLAARRAATPGSRARRRTTRATTIARRTCPSGTAGSRRRAPKGASLPFLRSGFQPCGGPGWAALEREQEQERDEQRKDAERLGNGETENQIAELAGSSGRI